MKDTIESNRQDYDQKMRKFTEDLTATIKSNMDQNKISKSSSDKKYSPKAQDPTTVVQDSKRSAPLESGHSKKW